MKKDIYIIKNDINSKVYIGQSKDYIQRFKSHCKPSASYIDNEPIAKAIQKYGREHFTVELLEAQIENYNEREKYWIEKYNSLIPNGYNILSGGDEPPLTKGSNHPESILTESQIKELTLDLQTTQLKFEELAHKYGFNSRTSIAEFNYGKTYKRNISYPIREENPIGKLTNSQVEQIITELKTTYNSFEVIAKKYQVEARAISRINRGLFHNNPNEKYPIREAVGDGKLTYENVTEIINLLLNSDKSLRYIAKLYSCEYKDILGIKNGTTKLYRRNDLTYPLRKNN